MMNRRTEGAKYEQAAAAYLAGKGYQILERNYRNRYGEIDVIAAQDSVLVFAEIKFRHSEGRGDPLEAVDVRKQRRICRTAYCYYAGHGFDSDVSCRFDVLGIYGNGRIRHVENAFEFVYG